MAAGNPLGPFGRRLVSRAVDDAERRSGLQICVYVGPADGDPRGHAEQLLAEAGARSRPAVMLYVAPEVRRVEVVTHPDFREHVPDHVAQAAVDAMVERFRKGDIVGGLRRGLRVIGVFSTPRTERSDDEELPDVLG